MGAIWTTFTNVANWNLDNLLKGIGLVFAAIGGVYSLIQLSSVAKTKRSQKLHELSEKYLEDEAIQEAVMITSYNGNLWYSLNEDDAFPDKDVESKIDKMLTFFNYVCYLKSIHDITHKEFAFFQYDMSSVCEKAQTQLYLWDLWKVSRLTNSVYSYRHLVAEMIEEGIIDSNKFSDDSSTNRAYVDKYIDMSAKLKAAESHMTKEEALKIVQVEAEVFVKNREEKVKKYQKEHIEKNGGNRTIGKAVDDYRKRKAFISELMK